MDENFAGFLEDFGPSFARHYVPPSSIERYRGKLPDQLLAYWQEHGWCGYADGLFWTVNPQEYEPVLQAWIGDTDLMKQDAYHVIARGAFGKLHLWGETTGNSLFISAPGSYCIPKKSVLVGDKMNLGIQVFFGAMSRQVNDFDGMFNAAFKKLGRLEHDEMYGFVPALALGGSATVDHLQKVKVVEHLVILAQLAPLDVITSPPL
jgi:hypothetical protein